MVYSPRLSSADLDAGETNGKRIILFRIVAVNIFDYLAYIYVADTWNLISILPQSSTYLHRSSHSVQSKVNSPTTELFTFSDKQIIYSIFRQTQLVYIYIRMLQLGY